MRESWTDDRMDDLVKRVDAGFAQVHEDIAALRVDSKELRRDMATLDGDRRAEMSTLGKDLRAEMGDLRVEMGAHREDQRVEMGAHREDVRAEMRLLASRQEMNERFDAFERRFDTLQGTLVAAILAGFVSLLVTHFA